MMLYKPGIVIILNAESHNTCHGQCSGALRHFILRCVADEINGIQPGSFRYIGIVHGCIVHVVSILFVPDNHPVIVDHCSTGFDPQSGNGAFAGSGETAE